MTRTARSASPGEARKRAVNLSVRADLLDEARSYGTNLSALLESALETEHGRLRTERWREDNRDAIEGWNRWVDENGIPFADLRSW
jgi:antitoxin CcdA